METKKLRKELKELKQTNKLFGGIIRELLNRLPKEKSSKNLIKYSGSKSNTNKEKR